MIRIIVVAILIVLTAQPVLARGHHHRRPEADNSGDRRGNNAYGNTKIEERDKLIGKLKNMNICRGC